jgi:hypothetical protein
MGPWWSYCHEPLLERASKTVSSFFGASFVSFGCFIHPFKKLNNVCRQNQTTKHEHDEWGYWGFDQNPDDFLNHFHILPSMQRHPCLGNTDHDRVQ